MLFKDKGKGQMSEARVLQWKLLDAGFHKLNTDASWKSIDKANDGGVIRKDDGSWLLGFSIKAKARDPAHVELLALKRVFNITEDDFGIQKLQIEMDASMIHKMLKEVEDYGLHQLGMIIQEVAGYVKTNFEA